MPDAPDVPTPIVVDPNPTLTQVNTGLRDLALVMAAVPTITALIGKHDMLGLVNWATSTAAAPVVGVLVTGGIFLWRQLNARWRRAKMVTLAKAAPDDVGMVKGAVQ